MPPYTNATLVRVKGPASADTWQDGGDPPSLWAGSERVYLNQRRLRSRTSAGGGQAQDFTTSRSLFVDVAIGVEFAEGQIVVYRRDGAGADEQAAIMSTRSTGAPAEMDTPPELNTVKLELDEPRPAA